MGDFFHKTLQKFEKKKMMVVSVSQGSAVTEGRFVSYRSFRAKRGRRPRPGATKAGGLELRLGCKALGYWDGKSEEKNFEDNGRQTDGRTVKNDTISYEDSPKCLFFCF